jgi:hypothetical protein
MSKPAWKIEREKKEAEARAKAAAEEEAKAAKIAATVEVRGAALDAERKARDAEDEAKIQALLREREASGIADTKDNAVKRGEAERSVLTESCVTCGNSLYNTGPFVRLGEVGTNVDERPAYHKACLVCQKCDTKGAAGIQIVDGVMTCFNCRQAVANNTPEAKPVGFCGNCGQPRFKESVQFCGGCGTKF